MFELLRVHLAPVLPHGDELAILGRKKLLVILLMGPVASRHLSEERGTSLLLAIGHGRQVELVLQQPPQLEDKLTEPMPSLSISSATSARAFASPTRKTDKTLCRAISTSASTLPLETSSHPLTTWR